MRHLPWPSLGRPSGERLSWQIGEVAKLAPGADEWEDLNTQHGRLAHAQDLIGAAQGYWVAYQKIPSFIVTLAGMLVFRGLTYVVLGGRPIGPYPKEFTLLSTGFNPDFLP